MILQAQPNWAYLVSHCNELTLTREGADLNRTRQKILSSSAPHGPPSRSLKLHKWLFFTFHKTSPSSREGPKLDPKRRSLAKMYNLATEPPIFTGFAPYATLWTVAYSFSYLQHVLEVTRSLVWAIGRSSFDNINRKYCGSALLCGCRAVRKNFNLQLFVHAAETQLPQCVSKL